MRRRKFQGNLATRVTRRSQSRIVERRFRPPDQQLRAQKTDSNAKRQWSRACAGIAHQQNALLHATKRYPTALSIRIRQRGSPIRSHKHFQFRGRRRGIFLKLLLPRSITRLLNANCINQFMTQTPIGWGRGSSDNPIRGRILSISRDQYQEVTYKYSPSGNPRTRAPEKKTQ